MSSPSLAPPAQLGGPAGELPRPGGRGRVRLGLVLAASALAAVGGYVVTRSLAEGPAPSPAAPAAVPAVAVPRNPEIEARYGIQVTRVGVSGDGGVVDLRYRVLDVEKAEHLRHHGANPQLIAARFSTDSTTSVWMPHGGPMRLGYEYYVLFPNQRGSVGAGDTVAIAVGDLRLEGVPVQ